MGLAEELWFCAMQLQIGIQPLINHEAIGN